MKTTNYLRIILLIISMHFIQTGNAGCGKPAPYIGVTSVGNLEFTFFCNAWQVEWLFGNGATKKGNGNYTYPNEGRYLIRVVVSDSLKSCSDTFTWDSLCAIRRSHTISKTGPFRYEFKTVNTDTTKRIIYWDPGNGSALSGHKVQYTFKAEGQYWAKLNIYDSLLYCSVTDQTIFFAAKCWGADTFGFTGSCSLDKTGNLIYWNQSAGGYGMNAEIFWGDGSSDTVYNRNTHFSKQHTWNTAGKKTMSLFVKDTAGCIDSMVQDFVVQDTALENKFLDYSISVTDLTLSVSINDVFAKQKFSYWLFGDGGSTGYYSSMSHVFPNLSKSYSVCAVYRTNENGSYCARSVCKTITIKPTKCLAQFSKFGDSLNPFKMTVYNYSYGSRYHWDFGDGDTSNNYTPSHTYSGLGPFNLCITAYDSGCTHTYCDSIGFDSSGKMNRSNFFLQVVDANGQVGVKVKGIPNAISIYPNPARSHVTIMNRGNEGIEVEFLDMNGRLILTKHVDAGKEEVLNISNLRPALYLLKTSVGVSRFLKLE